MTRVRWYSDNDNDDDEDDDDDSNEVDQPDLSGAARRQCKV